MIKKLTTDLELKVNSGVDINLGNECSSRAYKLAMQSFKNRQGKIGHPINLNCADNERVSSLGGFSTIVDYGPIKIGITADGIGTKIEVAERMGIYSTLGFDLIAMVVDDLVCNGVVPTNVTNVLDVDYFDRHIVDELFGGLVKAAEVAEVAIVGGESAELGRRISGFADKMHCNWSATAIGVLPTQESGSNFICGSGIQSGDVVVAFKERGFRSNGFSLIRKILNNHYKNNWPRDLGEQLLTPSTIYSSVVVKLLYEEKIDIKGIAHITGGSYPNKLKRVLKYSRNIKNDNKPFGAYLYDLFAPEDFVLKIQELGFLSDDMAYSHFNMGNGMLLVVGSMTEAKRLVSFVNLHYQQEMCKVAGEIIDDSIIRINSKALRAGPINFGMI